MGSVTGYTAAKMQQLVNSMIKSARVSGDDLILTRYDGSEFDAGMVRGPQGDSIKGDPGNNGKDAAIIDVYHPQSDPIGAYPIGISMFQITTQTDWPTTAGVVQTTQVSGGRAYQLVTEKTTGIMWRRASTDAPTNWGPWILVYGYMRDLDNVTNLNSVIGPGSYLQSTDSYATSGLNYPKAKAGLLKVDANSAGSHIFQEYTVYAGPTYARSCRAGAWTTWLMTAKPASTTDLSSGYQNNFVSANGAADNMTIFQRNGLCHIRGRVRQTAGFTGGKVCDIPAGLKPAFDTSPVPIYAGNGGNAPGPYIWGAVGATNGLVISKGNNATSPVWDSATWITVDIKYISEET